MLTIPQRLPIKQMALYGTTAVLVGFTGTLTVLQNMDKKGAKSGVAVVETINKKPSSPEQASAQSSTQPEVTVSTTPASQGGIAPQATAWPAPNYTFTAKTTPVARDPAPVVSPSVDTAPVSTDTSTVDTTTTQPVSSPPSTSEPVPAEQPVLQDATTDLLNVDIVPLP